MLEGDGFFQTILRRGLEIAKRRLFLLSQLKLFESDTAGGDLGEVVVRLLGQPGCGAASENLGEPYGHFRRDSALPVHQFWQRGARDAERGGGVRDSQAQRLNALAQYKAARVRWIFHRFNHSLDLLLGTG